MPVSNHGKAKSSFNYQWNSKSTLPHVAAEGLSVFMLETSAQKKICRRTTGVATKTLKNSLECEDEEVFKFQDDTEPLTLTSRGSRQVPALQKNRCHCSCPVFNRRHPVLWHFKPEGAAP